jgi:hypothetical protein
MMGFRPDRWAISGAFISVGYLIRPVHELDLRGVEEMGLD